jgi:hypothetical protein
VEDVGCKEVWEFLYEVTSKMVENTPYSSGHKQIDPTRPGELDPMANMMISPFLKLAAVVLAKRAIVSMMNSASLSELSLRLMHRYI